MPHSFADRIAAETSDSLLLLGRLAIGVIFLDSGLGKLMDLGAFASGLAGRGVPLAQIVAPVGAAVEFFCGLAVILGLQTRYAAALLIVFTILATLIAHRYWEFAEAARRMQHIQLFKNVAIIGGFLFLIVSAGGRFSVDHLLRGRASA